MADRDVNPDDYLLQHIFKTEQPTSTSTLLQNWDKCIFRASFSDSCLSCVVRLEAEDTGSETFTSVAAMQKIVRTIIPELVPQTYKVGQVENAEGRSFQFSMIELVEGVLLEDVWEKMVEDDKTSVVTEITSALSKLQSVRISDAENQKVFCSMLHGEDQVLERLQRPGVFGGPATRVLNNGMALLNAIIEQQKVKKSFCTLTTLEDLQITRVVSNYKDLGSVVIDKSDIAK
jgi:hypothetical protein